MTLFPAHSDREPLAEVPLPSTLSAARKLANELARVGPSYTGSAPQEAAHVSDVVLEFADRLERGPDSSGLDYKGESYALLQAALADYAAQARHLLASNALPLPTPPLTHQTATNETHAHAAAAKRTRFERFLDFAKRTCVAAARGLGTTLLAVPALTVMAVVNLLRKLRERHGSGQNVESDAPPQTGADPGAALLHRFGLHRLRPLVRLFNWLLSRSSGQVKNPTEINQDNSFFPRDVWVTTRSGGLRSLLSWLADDSTSLSPAERQMIVEELYPTTTVFYGRAPTQGWSSALVQSSFQVTSGSTTLPLPSKVRIAHLVFHARSGNDLELPESPLYPIMRCRLGGVVVDVPLEAHSVTLWCAPHESDWVPSARLLAALRSHLSAPVLDHPALARLHAQLLRDAQLSDEQRVEHWRAGASLLRPLMYCTDPVVQHEIGQIPWRAELVAASGVGTCLTLSNFAVTELLALHIPALVVTGASLNHKSGSLEVNPGHAVALALTPTGAKTIDLTEDAADTTLQLMDERAFRKRFSRHPTSAADTALYGRELGEFLSENGSRSSMSQYSFQSPLPMMAVRQWWRSEVCPLLQRGAPLEATQRFISDPSVRRILHASHRRQNSEPSHSSSEEFLLEVIGDLERFHRSYPTHGETSGAVAAFIDHHVFLPSGRICGEHVLHRLVHSPLFADTLSVRAQLYVIEQLFGATCSTRFEAAYFERRTPFWIPRTLERIRTLTFAIEKIPATTNPSPEEALCLRSIVLRANVLSTDIAKSASLVPSSHLLEPCDTLIALVNTRFPTQAVEHAAELLELFAREGTPPLDSRPQLFEPLRAHKAAPNASRELRSRLLTLFREDPQAALRFAEAALTLGFRGTMSPLTPREVGSVGHALRKKIRTLPEYTGVDPMAALCRQLRLNPIQDDLLPLGETCLTLGLTKTPFLPVEAGVSLKPWSEQRLFRWLCRRGLEMTDNHTLQLRGDHPLELSALPFVCSTIRPMSRAGLEAGVLIAPSTILADEIHLLRVITQSPRHLWTFARAVVKALRRSEPGLDATLALRSLHLAAAYQGLPPQERYLTLLSRRLTDSGRGVSVVDALTPPEDATEVVCWARKVIATQVPMGELEAKFPRFFAGNVGLPMELAMAFHGNSPERRDNHLVALRLSDQDADPAAADATPSIVHESKDADDPPCHRLWSFTSASSDFTSARHPEGSPAWEVCRRPNARTKLDPLGLRRSSGYLTESGLTTPPGGAGDYHDSRPYGPGDSLRLIDRRIWATTDRLHTQRFREREMRPTIVVVDLEWLAEKLPAWRTTGRHERLEELAEQIQTLDSERRPYRVLCHFRGHPLETSEDDHSFAGMLKHRWWLERPELSAEARRDLVFSNLRRPVTGRPTEFRVSNSFATELAGIEAVLLAERTIGISTFPLLKPFVWTERSIPSLPSEVHVLLYCTPRNLPYAGLICAAARRRNAHFWRWQGPK